MKKYVYGGYLTTGGTLDSGAKWSGFSVLLGELSEGSNMPMFGRACSGSGKNEELEETLSELVPGTICNAFFGMPDAKGKVKLEALVPVNN